MREAPCEEFRAWRIGGVDRAVDVALSSELGCALEVGGGVRCWREPDDEHTGEEVATLTLPGVATAVAVDSRRICVLREGGRVHCWATSGIRTRIVAARWVR